MTPDAQRFAILHTLRRRGVVDVGAVAAELAAAENEVERALDALSDEGLVKRWSGRLPGWGLTDAGRTEDERLAAAELHATGTAQEVEALYARFLPLNRRFLELCRDWQLVAVGDSRTPNDHRDAAYDASVISRLCAIDREAQNLTAELTGCLARFGGYGERLRNALVNVESGEQDWFTRPGIDSYHTVWFELHEDLLATLGRERANEREAN